ncbi:hypothetical protein H5410_060574 [Solanum commersonii]|uniref:Uncharacterized protein n=1 Tax=Solanum commersonii TaxID=4109 RepID=A0A9J5W6G6_SOLCO|nr:hypothetical protein H5410_060574 [Solanum commersonii]
MESFLVLGHLNTLVELELAFKASMVSMRFFDISVYLEFEEKHGHYLAKKEQRQLKEQRNKDLRITEPVRRVANRSYRSSVLSPEGKDQIGGEKEQSACC